MAASPCHSQPASMGAGLRRQLGSRSPARQLCRRRQLKAFRSGLLRASVVATAILLLVGGSGFWCTGIVGGGSGDNEYYEQVVRRFGLPVGVGPISREAARHRNATYKLLKRQGDDVLRPALEQVDALGKPNSGLDWEEYLSIRCARSVIVLRPYQALPFRICEGRGRPIALRNCHRLARRRESTLSFAPTERARSPPRACILYKPRME